MKLLDILLERHEDGYGYRDESLDKRKVNFVCYTTAQFSIVNDPNTNTIYGIDTESISDDYEFGVYEWEEEQDYDRDDEGYSSVVTNYFKEFGETQLEPDSVSLFVEDYLDEATEDFSKFEDGTFYIVKLTPENKKRFYEFFHDEILDYIESSHEKENKN